MIINMYFEFYLNNPLNQSNFCLQVDLYLM